MSKPRRISSANSGHIGIGDTLMLKDTRGVLCAFIVTSLPRKLTVLRPPLDAMGEFYAAYRYGEKLEVSGTLALIGECVIDYNA